jgi:type III restriction enzyme
MLPSSPFRILSPDERWAPAQSQIDATQNAYEKLLPPLVYKVRRAVAAWRERAYEGASATSMSLLHFWFQQEHRIATKTGTRAFQFYFSQREAIESIIYLYEIAKAHDKYELMKFDSSGRVSTGMFDEAWTRYGTKMATGAGKTKVMGLTLVWSHFHKIYEPDSTLSQNTLVIAPNIIVFKRLLKDFENFTMFNKEPFIPDDGFDNHDWQSDFQPTLHIQDKLTPLSETGNIFLTNIHRVFLNENPLQSVDTTLLGAKPKPDADTAKGMDLGKILRSSQIQDLLVLNDEAHHVHDKDLAWFKNIEDIHNKLTRKNGRGICLQADFSATPKHTNGGIFVQTISDFPLVEAIRTNVVKSPVLPDEDSRAKVKEKQSDTFTERYHDFIHLGYIEWEKQYEALKTQKTPILFVMTNNTKEADECAAFLEENYPLLKNSVLTIHTNASGDIKETVNSKKDQKELEKLRDAANAIDTDASPYRAVVSVLMLREGWDVQNIATIVGLRPYGADAKILPEQTIGRGLRKMFPLDVREELVIVGTPKFLEFVEDLKIEGVDFQTSPMGVNTKAKAPVIVEVDKDNEAKNLDALDIPIPKLSPRVYREYTHLSKVDIEAFTNERIPLKTFHANELREIIFQDIDGNFSHKTMLTDIVPDYRNVVSFFTASVLKESRLVSGFDILYPKVEAFIKNKLFMGKAVLLDPTTLRNLAEAEVKKMVFTTFKQAIDTLTVSEKSEVTINERETRRMQDARPTVAPNQSFLIPKKSVFNKIIADNKFELSFAAALESRFSDVIGFAKNTRSEGGVNFKIEYQAENGNIRDYFPDFFVKTAPSAFFIVETKGREDADDRRKIQRLAVWCADVNAAQTEYTYTPLYVKQEDWEKYEKDLKSFADCVKLFPVPENTTNTKPDSKQP